MTSNASNSCAARRARCSIGFAVGALRILTKSPISRATTHRRWSTSAIRPMAAAAQRYNAMVNIPLVPDKLAPACGRLSSRRRGLSSTTSVRASRTPIRSTTRAVARFCCGSRPISSSVRLLGSYEDSHPEDSSLSNPTLGERKRYSVRPDLYTSKTQIYNATLNYRFDGADLTSSSTYSLSDGFFAVDLAGTFARAIPFYLLRPV